MRKWHDYLNSVQYDEKRKRARQTNAHVYCVLNVFNIQLCKKNSRKIVLRTISVQSCTPYNLTFLHQNNQNIYQAWNENKEKFQAC